MKFLKHLKRAKKAIISILLSSNLIFLSTGSVQLNSSTDSANLQQEATPTAVVSPQTSPSPSPSANGTEDILVSKNLPFSTKIDPTGSFFEDDLILIFKDNVSEDTQRNILLENNLVIRMDSTRIKDKLIKVEPAQRDQVLANLKNNPNVEYVGLK